MTETTEKIWEEESVKHADGTVTGTVTLGFSGISEEKYAAILKDRRQWIAEELPQTKVTNAAMPAPPWPVPPPTATGKRKYQRRSGIPNVWEERYVKGEENWNSLVDAFYDKFPKNKNMTIDDLRRIWEKHHPELIKKFPASVTGEKRLVEPPTGEKSKKRRMFSQIATAVGEFKIGDHVRCINTEAKLKYSNGVIEMFVKGGRMLVRFVDGPFYVEQKDYEVIPPEELPY